MSKPVISAEVRAYLSAIGKRGGLIGGKAFRRKTEAARLASIRNGALGGRPKGSKSKAKCVQPKAPQ